MPTLEGWSLVLASAAEKVLSVPEVNYRLPVHASPPAVLAELPCVIVEWGDGGVFLQPSNGGTLSTLCQMTAQFTVRLAVGDPGGARAASITLDALQRLYAGLADAIAADPANTSRYRPGLGDVLTPTAEEWAAMPIWSARIPLAVPVAKIPPTTP